MEIGYCRGTQKCQSKKNASPKKNAFFCQNGAPCLPTGPCCRLFFNARAPSCSAHARRHNTVTVSHSCTNMEVLTPPSSSTPYSP